MKNKKKQNKKISDKLKENADLKQIQKNIAYELNEIDKSASKNSLSKQSKDWLEELSIRNLQDYQDAGTGSRNDYCLFLLYKNSISRESRKEKFEKFLNIGSKITINNIDILLEKVKQAEEILEEEEI